MKTGQQLYIAYAKLISVILIWGLLYHVAKIIVAYQDVFTISFLRFVLAAFILGIPYFKKHGLADFKKKTKTEFFLLFCISIFGVFLYNLFFFAAEVLISAEAVAVIYAATPCFTIVLSAIFLKYKINSGGWLGLFIAAIGAVGVINYSDVNCGKFFCESLFTHISIGQIFALLAVLCMAVYNVLNRKAGTLNLTSTEIVTFSVIVGAILLFIPALIWGNMRSLATEPITFWVCLLYLAILGTSVSYRWYVDSIRDLGIGQTTVFQNGVPFATILTGIMFFDQSLSLGISLSGIIIIFGVVFTNWQVNKVS